MGVLDDITAAQNQSAQWGQESLNDYKNKASEYGNQFNNYQGQADTARGNIDSFNNYMGGAGSAANLYKNAFSDNAAKAGYSQDALNQAQGNVSQAAGAQSAYNDYANTAASKWGMNAGALAASNANAQSGLNNNIAAASTTLGTQQKAYENAQNATSQQAGLGIQQQQTQLAGYKTAFDSATSQMNAAKDQMQYFEGMAQKQGGLNADMYNQYQATKTSYQQAQAAAAANYAAAQASIASANKTNYEVQSQRDLQSYYKANGFDPSGNKVQQPAKVNPTTNQSNNNNQGYDARYGTGNFWADPMGNAGKSIAHFFVPTAGK